MTHRRQSAQANSERRNSNGDRKATPTAAPRPDGARGSRRISDAPQSSQGTDGAGGPPGSWRSVYSLSAGNLGNTVLAHGHPVLRRRRDTKQNPGEHDSEPRLFIFFQESKAYSTLGNAPAKWTTGKGSQAPRGRQPENFLEMTKSTALSYKVQGRAQAPHARHHAACSGGSGRSRSTAGRGHRETRAGRNGPSLPPARRQAPTQKPNVMLQVTETGAEQPGATLPAREPRPPHAGPARGRGGRETPLRTATAAHLGTDFQARERPPGSIAQRKLDKAPGRRKEELLPRKDVPGSREDGPIS